MSPAAASGSGATIRIDASPVAYCEEVTRRRARNFWYGIRLLPPAKRHALAAVYAMSRRIDDVGDGDMPLEQKRAALDDIEDSLGAVRPDSADPVLAALAQAGSAFPIPLGAFGDLVAGVRMDLDGVEYATFDDLVPYCRRVAGSVGRLSLSVFGAPDPPSAEPLADDLGVAMQLTNVLRDVHEDLGRGRVYLPAEDLDRFGVELADLAGPGSDRTASLIRFEADRGRSWFRRGLGLLSMLDRRSRACAGAMSGIYSRLLLRIEATPNAVLTGRLSLSGGQKAWVAWRALWGAAA